MIDMDDLDRLTYLLQDATNRHRQWMDIILTGSIDSADYLQYAMGRAEYYGTSATNIRAQLIEVIMKQYGYKMVSGRYLKK